MDGWLCYDKTIRENKKEESVSMKKSDLTFRYGLIHGSYWMAFAAVSGYVSLYLLELGFSSTVIGGLIALSGLLSAVAQPLVAGYADRPDSISLKAVNVIVALLALLCSGVLLAVRGSRVLTLVFYGLDIALLQLSTPLVSALGINSLNCGTRLNYGVSKAVSSVTYAAASFAMGRLTERLGGWVVPVAMCLFYTLFLGSLLLYPREKAPAAEGGRGAGFFGFFRKYPRFTLVLLGCVLLFVSHVLLNNFTLQIIRTKGGGSREMGVAMALAALSELPTMLGFTWLMKKAPSHVWLQLTGIFFTLKILGSLLCGTVGAFYALQFLQLLAWALIALSAVYYINAVMAPEDAIKGQAYYTMAYTVGSVVGAVIGGRIIDMLGVNAMLVFGTACAALGTVVIAVFAQRTEDRLV